VNFPQWTLSGGQPCGQPIAPPPPDLGYRLSAPSTSAPVQSSLSVPIRLHNDTEDDVVGWTSRTPWAAVTTADGVIVALTTGMRASAQGLTVPAGSFYDWTTPVPFQLCRDRPLGAPREYLATGTYQLWVHVDIRPDSEVRDVVFAFRGGPFELVLDAQHPD
jgi:hypothetical protein